MNYIWAGEATQVAISLSFHKSLLNVDRNLKIIWFIYHQAPAVSNFIKETEEKGERTTNEPLIILRWIEIPRCKHVWHCHENYFKAQDFIHLYTEVRL